MVVCVTFDSCAVVNNNFRSPAFINTLVFSHSDIKQVRVHL